MTYNVFGETLNLALLQLHLITFLSMLLKLTTLMLGVFANFKLLG